jgi:hypothetical protein
MALAFGVVEEAVFMPYIATAPSVASAAKKKIL